MRRARLPGFAIVLLLALAILCTPAHATGGFGCGSDERFLCPIALWNVGVGLMLMGIPISVGLFVGLHWWWRPADASKPMQVLKGAIHGLIVFEAAVVCAAILLPWLESLNLPVPEQAVGFIGVYGVLLIASTGLLARKHNASLEKRER